MHMIDRSLAEQILCENTSPPAAQRKPLELALDMDAPKLSRANTLRIWLMRLQRLECDYFDGGPDIQGSVKDWVHGHPQHARQAFLESLWAGYRSGALALRKTFTAWCCICSFPKIQSENLRKYGCERMEKAFEHYFIRSCIYHLSHILHAWAKVVENSRFARHLMCKKEEYSKSLFHEVRRPLFAFKINRVNPFWPFYANLFMSLLMTS
jgi:hypothetical protein